MISEKLFFQNLCYLGRGVQYNGLAHCALSGCPSREGPLLEFGTIAYFVISDDIRQSFFTIYVF